MPTQNRLQSVSAHTEAYALVTKKVFENSKEKAAKQTVYD